MTRLAALWRRVAFVVVPALVVLVFVLAVFWRSWTPLEGERRAFAWDAQWEYWGDLQLQTDAVRAGELPAWNPHDRLGYPFFADPQAGNLYPPQWGLIAGSLALGDTPWWMITVKNLFHMWLGGLGMYWLLRRRQLPAPACYLGSVVLLTSYAVLHNAPSALCWSFAWVPWWLLAAEAWLERPTWRRGVGVGVLAALSALAGAWGSFWYGLLVVAPLTAVGVVGAARAVAGAERRAYLRAIVGTGAVAVGVFVLLTGAQLMATAGLVADTVRDDRGVTFFGTTVFSAVDIIGFFLPRGQGENTYLGWGPILWSAMLVALRPTARQLTLVAIILLSVLCAMGDRGPVLPSLASLVTPFELFRRAHRYLYVAVIPLGILAAEGLALIATLDDDGVRQKLRRVLTRVVAVVVIVCGVAFAVKMTSPWKVDPVRDQFGWGLAAVILAGVTTWLVLAHQGKRALLVAAVVVAGLDLWIARGAVVEAAFQAVPSTKNDGLLAGRADVPRPWRIYDHGKLGFRPGVRLGLRDLGGYEGDPLALQRFDRVLRAVEAQPRLAAYAGIGYVFDGTARPLPHADPKLLEPIGKGAFRVVGPAPDVAWFDVATVAADADDAWKRATAGAPGAVAAVERAQLDPATAARVAKIDTPATPTAVGRVTGESLDQLTAEIDAPGDGLVRIDELYYPHGWTATVDGKAAPIIAVDGFARGVLVGPGHHVIAMRFHAGRYLAGGAAAILGWLALAGLGVAQLVRRRRRTRA